MPGSLQCVGAMPYSSSVLQANKGLYYRPTRLSAWKTESAVLRKCNLWGAPKGQPNLQEDDGLPEVEHTRISTQPGVQPACVNAQRALRHYQRCVQEWAPISYFRHK